MNLPTHSYHPRAARWFLAAALGLMQTVGGCSLLLDEAADSDASPNDAMTAFDSALDDASPSPRITRVDDAIQFAGARDYVVANANTLLLVAAAGGASAPVVSQDAILMPLVNHQSGVVPNRR